jgi:hypothetical protein
MKWVKTLESHHLAIDTWTDFMNAARNQGTLAWLDAFYENGGHKHVFEHLRRLSMFEPRSKEQADKTHVILKSLHFLVNTEDKMNVVVDMEGAIEAITMSLSPDLLKNWKITQLVMFILGTVTQMRKNPEGDDDEVRDVGTLDDEA